MDNGKKVTIIGAGPAGLFCAALLLKEGFAVDIYDHSSGAGKKFLIAGNGGLNLTHSELLSQFAGRYGRNEELFKELLRDFSPQDLRDWLSTLGTETFVGTSGRVFPKEMSAGKVLLSWLDHMKSYPNFKIHLKHKFIGISPQKKLTFTHEGSEVITEASTVIFALGGGSWKKTGSDGLWVHSFQELGIQITPLQPMNCGFERTWSDFFKTKVERSPLKNIKVSLEVHGQSHSSRGDAMLTPYGIEGGAIYALSRHIRDEITAQSKATITIDFKPDLSEEEVTKRVEERAKKVSLANFLRKRFNLGKEASVLFNEVFDSLHETDQLVTAIKKLPLTLDGIRPIDEAISTSGGIPFEALTENFELKNIPGVFFTGEMLDFEAPTGGYLLQGCFSTAFRVARAISSRS